jgi:hypothetical protein
MSDNKKLNKAEISESELEGINGGTTREIFSDNSFLKSIGVTENYWGYVDFLFDDGKGAAIAKEWEKVGVRCIFDPNGTNRYFIDKGEISRTQAIDYAKKFIAEKNK